MEITTTFRIEITPEYNENGIKVGDLYRYVRGTEESSWMKRHRILEQIEAEFRLHRCQHCGAGFTKTHNKQRHETNCQHAPNLCSEEFRNLYTNYLGELRATTSIDELNHVVAKLPAPQ